MGEKEFNTDDFDEDISLASQLGKRRRSRRSAGTLQREEDIQENEDILEDDADVDYEEQPLSSEDLGRTVQRADRRKMRITMLGISGSGKTAFLSGVYQTMMMGSFHGLTLLPADSDDQAYQQIGQIADIALVNRDNYEFPLGTEETTIFPLTLTDGGREICDFDFTDYRGGDVMDILNARVMFLPVRRH